MNGINSTENPFRFTEVDSSMNLLTKQFKKILLRADIQISPVKMKSHRFSKIMTKKTKKLRIWIMEAVGVTNYSKILVAELVSHSR